MELRPVTLIVSMSDFFDSPREADYNVFERRAYVNNVLDCCTYWSMAFLRIWVKSNVDQFCTQNPH